MLQNLVKVRVKYFSLTGFCLQIAGGSLVQGIRLSKGSLFLKNRHIISPVWGYSIHQFTVDLIIFKRVRIVNRRIVLDKTKVILALFFIA